MPARNRWFWDDDATATAAESISIVETVPVNCELIQWSIRFGVIPLAPENVVLMKNALVLRQFDPAELGGANFACDNVWHFKKDDIVTFSYTNTDDEDVEAELIFREATP